MVKLSRKNGQSIAEYMLLIGIVIAALLIMQIYIKRSYQGRLKAEADQVGEQYSPGHTTGVTQSLTKIKTSTYTGGKFTGDNGQETVIPYGMTVTRSNTQNALSKQEGVDSFAAER